MKYILSIILLVYLSINVSAQNFGCNAVTDSNRVTALNKFIQKSVDRSVRTNDTPIKIGLSIYAFGTSDGENRVSADTIYNSITYLNSVYAGANISFFLLGDINFIDLDRLYFFDIQDNSSDQNEIDRNHSIYGALNIYYVGPVNEGNSYPSGWCGMAYFPDQKKDKVILSNSCASGPLLAHEIGHSLSLLHTHEKFLGNELVDGSNCSTAGDQLCDTPADPLLSKSNVNGNCQYTSIAKDENGELYSPSVANLMSYAPDACRSTFTDQQLTKMIAAYNAYKTHLISEPYLALFSSEDTSICIDQSVNFNNASINATSYVWEFEGGIPATSSDKNPTVVYQNLGSYDVSLAIINENGDTFRTAALDYIKVNDKTLSNQVALNGSFEDSLIIEQVINPDLLSTFSITNNAASTGKQAAWFNFYDYEDSQGAMDYLILGEINNAIRKTCYVSFDYAYTYFNEEFLDTLALVYREPCGEWVTIWEKGGSDLNTADPDSTQIFIPLENEWSRVFIPVSLPDETSTTEFAFQTKSGWGNALYLDNYKVLPIPEQPTITRHENKLITNKEEGYEIQWFLNDEPIENSNADTLLINNLGDYKVKVFNDACNKESMDFNVSEVVSSPSISVEMIKIYPNPAQDFIKIELLDEVNLDGLSYEIVNTLGQNMMNKTDLLNKVNSIDVSNVEKGTYVIKVYNDKGIKVNQSLFFKY